MLIVRDGDGNDAGEIVAYRRLETRDVLNGVGGWRLELEPSNPAVPALRTAGAGIAVVDPATDSVSFSGPAYPAAAGTSSTRRTEPGSDLVTFTGTNDLGVLWWRRCVPPAGATHATASGTYGVAAARLVSDQLAETADDDRRLGPWRTIEDETIGDTVTLSSRYGVLGDVLTEQVGDLVLSAKWTTSGPIVFRVAEQNMIGFPLSVADGTVALQVIDAQPAVQSVVYGLGAGQGLARVIVEAGTATGWDRIEGVTDRRDLGDATAVATYTQAQVNTGLETVALTLADDYGLQIGDTCNVDVWGTETELVVSAVETTVTPNMTRRTVEVGEPSPTAIDRIIAAARRTTGATDETGDS